MLVSDASVTPRRVDDSLLIVPLYDGKGFSFDVAKASIDGTHPPVVNRVSDRVYYFLKGNAEVEVDGRQFNVSPGDLIVIHTGQVHALEGNAEYLIVTAPPFDPANE
jgi:mannose-6-phosphate isomerase-like protein (cupin superfamily)